MIIVHPEVDVWGFEHAIRGMRNPLNSWNRIDSDTCIGCIEGEVNDIDCKCYDWCDHHRADYGKFILGHDDLTLMRKLYKAGTEHRKFLRQIIVSMDITAPLYFWKEFDTYKIGTTSNSCSTMHTIHKKKFEYDDFSHEHLIDTWNVNLHLTIGALNEARDRYLETKNKIYWWQLIQLLPSSYNQKRTITMNYENAVNMIHQRTGHKLDEWNDFVDELKGLPYLKDIMQEEH